MPLLDALRRQAREHLTPAAVLIELALALVGTVAGAVISWAVKAPWWAYVGFGAASCLGALGGYLHYATREEREERRKKRESDRRVIERIDTMMAHAQGMQASIIACLDRGRDIDVFEVGPWLEHAGEVVSSCRPDERSHGRRSTRIGSLRLRLKRASSLPAALPAGDGAPEPARRPCGARRFMRRPRPCGRGLIFVCPA